MSLAPGGTGPETPAVAPPPAGGSRTARLLGAVRVGYLYQAVVLAAGIWLAPFLIDRLGRVEYGLWLNAAQIIMWLSILDLGIVSIIPRETAYAIGAATRENNPADVPRLIGRTGTLLLWQLPFVALATAIAWALLPSKYDALNGPLLLVFAAFVVGFPFRMLQALLQGFQDLTYVSVHTFVSWALGLVITVLLAESLQLYALAFSYAAAQLYQYIAYGYRLWTRHRHLLPQRLLPLAWPDARVLLVSGGWISVGQVAQVLLAGTDILIITNVLNAEAAVPYSITAKLVAALANQPAIVMQAAMPGIAEIRGADDMPRLKRAAGALGQMLLILSCVVFCIVLGLNRAFVEWWPGLADGNYSGDRVTATLLIAMVARHANFAVSYTLFALGGERRISITNLLDGLVTLSSSVLLVRAFGVVGAPVGSLLGVVLVSIPANLRGLAARTGVPVSEWLQPFWGWGWRFAVLAGGAAMIARQGVPPTFAALVVGGAMISLVVLATMAPVALRPPLGAYVVPRLPWRRTT